MSQHLHADRADRPGAPVDETRCDGAVMIAGVALAPVIALTAVGFLGYSISAAPFALGAWHPVGRLVTVASASVGGLGPAVWPGTVETLGVLAWRLMMSGLATTALVGLLLLPLTTRRVPPVVERRFTAAGSFWPRLIGFLIAAALIWSVYGALLRALP